jgi:hypothetical protein
MSLAVTTFIGRLNSLAGLSFAFSIYFWSSMASSCGFFDCSKSACVMPNACLSAVSMDMISTVPEGVSVRVVVSRIFESLKSRVSNFDASRSSLLVDWSLR